MRIAIGGIYHESNSFASKPTTTADFRASSVLTGRDIIKIWADTNSEIAGFLDGIRAVGAEAVPTLMAWGMPSGPVTEDALEELTGELCSRLGRERDLAGVLLVCHGAMVSEGRTNPDGYWLKRVRETVGSKTPVVVTLDFHANLTPDMLRAVDAATGYRTYPHIDYRERGREAADVLARIAKYEIRPVMQCWHVPVIPNLLTQFTSSPPMQSLADAAEQLRADPHCISASVFGGFQWADVPHNGISVLAISDGDNPEVLERARGIAEKAWDLRHGFHRELPSVQEAVASACDPGPEPAILVDTGDNLGGGSPGDGTVLLAELLRQGAENAVVLLYDPETVERASQTGVRNTALFRLGGKTDALHGAPVETAAAVRLISDGQFVNIGPMRDGLREDMGRVAVLQASGVVIVATEKRTPMWNLEQLRSLGIEPTRQRIIVVKAAIAHRAAYSPIAGRMIEVNTPGITSLDISRFPFRNQRRPVYPLDDNFDPHIK